MNDRIDRAVDAATGFVPTAGIMSTSVWTILADPGLIASWAAAVAGVLFVCIQCVRLYREILGARKDREDA